MKQIVFTLLLSALAVVAQMPPPFVRTPFTTNTPNANQFSGNAIKDGASLSNSVIYDIAGGQVLVTGAAGGTDPVTLRVSSLATDLNSARLALQDDFGTLDWRMQDGLLMLYDGDIDRALMIADRTNAIISFPVTSSKVGIGTTTPAANLDVPGTAAIGSLTVTGAVTTVGIVGVGPSVLELKDAAGNLYLASYGTNGGMALIITNNINQGASWDTNGTLYVNSTNGAGQSVVFRHRNTNSNYEIAASVNGAAFSVLSTFNSSLAFSLGGGNVTMSSVGTFAMPGNATVNASGQYFSVGAGTFGNNAALTAARLNVTNQSAGIVGLRVGQAYPQAANLFEFQHGGTNRMFGTTNGAIVFANAALLVVPTPAQIGAGGAAFWASNGIPWTAGSADGSTYSTGPRPL